MGTNKKCFTSQFSTSSSFILHTMKPIITAYFFFYSNQFIQHHSFSSLPLIKLSRITPAVDSPLDTTSPPSPNQALSNSVASTTLSLPSLGWGAMRVPGAGVFFFLGSQCRSKLRELNGVRVNGGGNSREF